MHKFTLPILMALTLFENTGFAQNLCSDIFSHSIYLDLKEMDSQKGLRKSWKTLFKSDDLASYGHMSDTDIVFFEAQSAQVTKSLPPEAQEALQGYSEISSGYSGAYEGINSYLREYVKGRPLTNKSVKPSLVPKSVVIKAKLIEKGIQQAPPLPEGLLLFRGLAIDPSSVAVGEKFKDFGFISTSLEPSVAYQFAQTSARNGEVPHLFIIEIKSKNIQGIPLSMSNESEILVQRDLEMLVQKISERTMQVRSPGVRSDRIVEVPFRIVHLTVGEP